VIEASFAIQKIELIGGESWLEHNSVAIAAITAAALAALVAVLNQRAQLKHDREMRNRDHIRDTIDSAIASANEALLAVGNFHSNVATAEEWREREMPDQEDKAAKAASREREERWSSELDRERDEAYPLIQSMRAANIRLEIRLGAAHPIVLSHDATRAAFFELFSASMGGVGKNRAQTERDKDGDLSRAVRDHFLEFRTAAQRWFNE
jgi:hypothetical protein